jgi:predicted nucleotidyltransferase
MRERIQAELGRIEAEAGVRILYACESGSRAWGFPSADSDCDVRFIYLHPREWYLSVDLERRRDVIGRPIAAQLVSVAGTCAKRFVCCGKAIPL